MHFFNVKLVKREEIADGTMAFHFEKPADFAFKAGQFMEANLLDADGAVAKVEGNPHAFSIAAAPSEPDLMIATRMRDSVFKNILKTMPLGGEIKIEGPFGDFVLHNKSERAAVFLMGGIGITPVRSMVAEAAAQKLPHKLFLFYSNRAQKDSAFFEELKNLGSKNPNYKFIPTMTDIPEGDASWSGERGYINAEMLKKYLSDLQGPLYYSAGPQGMVAAMRKMLNGAGVDDDDIRTEEFSGY